MVMVFILILQAPFSMTVLFGKFVLCSQRRGDTDTYDSAHTNSFPFTVCTYIACVYVTYVLHFESIVRCGLEYQSCY